MSTFIKICVGLIVLIAIGSSFIAYHAIKGGSNVNDDVIIQEIISSNDSIISQNDQDNSMILQELQAIKKREAELLKSYNEILYKYEKYNKKFDSTTVTNIELQQLFSDWSPR